MTKPATNKRFSRYGGTSCANAAGQTNFSQPAQSPARYPQAYTDTLQKLNKNK